MGQEQVKEAARVAKQECIHIDRVLKWNSRIRVFAQEWTGGSLKSWGDELWVGKCCLIPRVINKLMLSPLIRECAALHTMGKYNFNRVGALSGVAGSLGRHLVSSGSGSENYVDRRFNIINTWARQLRCD